MPGMLSRCLVAARYFGQTPTHWEEDAQAFCSNTKSITFCELVRLEVRVGSCENFVCLILAGQSQGCREGEGETLGGTINLGCQWRVSV